VHLTAFERGGTRGLLGHRAHDQTLDARGLPPITVEGLERDLHARGERHHAVGPGADRRLLEAVLADLLDVVLGHDPAGARGRGAVEPPEVRPRLLPREAHLVAAGELALL